MASTPWPSNVSEYINGHLGRYTLGEVGDGPTTWGLHLDTLLMSWLLAAIPFYYLYKVATTASATTPGKLQIFFELLVGFFDKQTRDLFPNAPPIIGPLAVTIFVWVVMMNTMDVLPVDLLASTGYLLTGSVPHFKLLPTADLSLTLALALSIFIMTIYYSFKVKGVGGFLYEIMSVPFGIWLMPINVLLRVVEEVAKPLSLSMRLFGNLFAAEMIFLLIAAISFAFGGAFLGQWIFGGPWAIYHILVIPLQAYLFATLAVVYLAMSHEKH